MTGSRPQVVVLGAGPAGLGLAYRLTLRRRFEVTVIERSRVAGGNAGSFEVDGLRVDYGSHRLHPSCRPEILADIRGFLGQDLLDRPRHGRIRLQGRWIRFPLKPLDLALNLPVSFSAGVLLDAFRKPAARGDGDSFASVLEAGLGTTLCRDFYFPYAKKIWGLEPDALAAEQAHRRVSANSLGRMVRRVFGSLSANPANSKGRFYYPRRGYGAISEAYCDAAIRQGAVVQFGSTVAGVEVQSGETVAVVADAPGGNIRLPASQVLSTIPLPALVRAIRPPSPESVRSSADALRYRAMILVYLVLQTDRFSEFDAHYFPDPDIPITRLSEPKNYGLAQVPGRTVLCAEIPCAVEDDLWSASEESLKERVLGALAQAGIPATAPVREVRLRRLAQAYPIYTRSYRRHFDLLDEWVGKIGGIVTLGRQGLFAHDNTHHALAMAYALSECLDEDGKLDRDRWAAHRKEFESHVVED